MELNIDNIVARAKKAAAKAISEVNNSKDTDIKNVYVTFPEQGVFINNPEDVMVEYCKRQNQNMIQVVKNGKVLADNAGASTSPQSVVVLVDDGKKKDADEKKK